MACTRMNRKNKCEKKTWNVCPTKKRKGLKKKSCLSKKKRCCRKIAVKKQIVRIIFPKGSLPICPSEPCKAKVSVIPYVQRYFTTVESDIPMTTSITFNASQFVNDAGVSASQFADHGQHGYFNLFINAVLQQGQLYSVNSDTLVIHPSEQMIKANTPIILEAVGFTAEII